MTKEEITKRLNLILVTDTNTLKGFTMPHEPLEKEIEALKEAIELINQEPSEDCVDRKEVMKFAEFVQSVKDEYCDNKEVLNFGTLCDIVIKAWRIVNLPPVTPQQKTGYWILADEQSKEDIENDNYRFICSECGCSDIHAKGTKVPYCWKCGAKMVDPQKVRNKD